MKLNKSKLHKMKKVKIIREHWPIKNSDFIEKTKKQIEDRFGIDAVKEFNIDLEKKEVEFRGQKVPLIDDTKPIETRSGTVTFRSKDYIFNSGVVCSYGEIDTKLVTDSGWILKCFDGSYYVYTIL